MKIYKIETEEDIFVVIADNEKEAKQIIFDEYFEEKVKVESVEVSEIGKGILVRHDYEDFYFEKLQAEVITPTVEPKNRTTLEIHEEKTAEAMRRARGGAG